MLVSAINLKQVEVKFNKAMNKDSVQDLTKYKLDGNVLGAPSIAKLQDDGKTVLITLADANVLPNNTSKTLVIDKVKSADGQESTLYSNSVSYADSTLPSIVKAEVTASNTIRVTFNEPVYDGVASANTINTARFTVDGGSYVIASATPVPDKSAVDLVLGSDIAAGNHTVKVSPDLANKIVDFAAYAPLSQTFNFSYVADTAAPTVSVKSATESKVTLLFSKSIDPNTLTANANVRFRHTYDTTANELLGNVGPAVAFKANTDNKELVLDFGINKPLAPGAVNLYIGYVSSSGQKVEDKFGNELAAATLTVNVIEDKTAPTVTSVSRVNNTSIDVTFSESVTGATTLSNYSLKDSNDDVVAISGAAVQNATDNVYRLTTDPLTGGTYKLTVSNVTDNSINANKMTAQTLQFSATDETSPTVSSVSANSDNNKVRVVFSEAMSDTGLTDKNSYQLDAADLTDGTTLTKIDNKTVEIAFPSAIAGLVGKNLSISGALTDLASNRIGGFFVTKAVTVDSVALVADSVKALDKRTIEFRVDKMVTSVTAANFAITNAYGIASVTAANDTVKGEGIITVKTSTDLDTGLAGTAWSVTVNAGGIKTVLGYTGSTIGAGITNAVAKDYIAPKLVSAATGDNDGDGQIDRITVTYSENIQQSSVTASDYTVENHTVSDYWVNGAVVTLKINESGAWDVDSTPKVTQVGEVADASAQYNVLGAQAAKTPTAIASAPALAGASVADTTGATNNGKGSVTLPVAGAGNTFVYTTSSSTVTSPFTGQNLSSWTAILNNDAVTFGANAAAANGKHIGIAEVDASGKAVKFVDITVAGIADYVAATSGSSVGSVAIATDAALAALTLSEDTKTLTYTIDTVAKNYTIAQAVTTKAAFLTALNTALGAAGTASFNASNQLVVVSATTGATSTVVVSGTAAAAIVGAATEVGGTPAAN